MKLSTLLGVQQNISDLTYNMKLSMLGVQQNISDLTYNMKLSTLDPPSTLPRGQLHRPPTWPETGYCHYLYIHERS